MKKVNTEKLTTQIDLLISDLVSGNKLDYEDKYHYIKESSESLYKNILKNYLDDNFKNTIKMFIDKLNLIQKGDLTERQASETIGKDLAYKYIPQYKNLVDEK